MTISKKLTRAMALVTMVTTTTGALTATSMMTGCSGQDGGASNAASATPAPTAPRFDGESLVRGVFFAQGEVAKLLPADRARTPTAEQSARIDAIVARVTAEDPAALAKFAADMQSGDIVRVRDAALAMGARLQRIDEALGALEGTVGEKSSLIVILFVPWLIVWAPNTQHASPDGPGLEADDWARGLSSALATSYAFDGETAFRGIFFAQGDAGRRLAPELEGKAPEGAAAAADRHVAWIRAHDPSFFTAFGTDAQSGDVVRIRQAIERGVAHVAAARPELVNEAADARMVWLDTPVLVLVTPPPFLYTIVYASKHEDETKLGLARDTLANRVAERLAVRLP